MKYRWKEKLLLKGLKNAINHNDKISEEHFNCMLALLNDIHADKIDLPDNNYQSMYDYYSNEMEYINADIFDRCVDIFGIVKDEDDLYTKIKHSNITLKNKELIELGYEMVESLKDKKSLEIYKELVKHGNHYLHIVDDDLEDIHDDVYGITYYDHTNEKPYVILKRRHTPYDIETFMHEVMHAIIYRYKDKDELVSDYFQELEGRFGERLATQYMREHNMEKWANEIDAYNLQTVLYTSFQLYLNDTLFYTAKDNKFNINKASSYIQTETPFKDAYLEDEDIPNICNINGFDTITNIIDYLICLELSKKYDTPEQFAFIKQLGKFCNSEFFNTEMKTMFDFYTDNNKLLIEEKERLDKVKRVIK